MMDLRTLRYFVSAVDEGSISAAAAKCYVAQPSITLAISKLEDHFNCQLLRRHRKGVDPTDKGQELYGMAVDLLRHAHTLEYHFMLKNKPEKLVLAIEKNIQLSYLQSLTHAIRACQLNLELELCERHDQADIRLISQRGKSKGDIFYPIATERYALLIPKHHSLAYKDKLCMADLNGHAIIERYQCENRPLFESMLAHFDLNLPVAARVDNEEWALALVAAGFGISISPVPIEYEDPRFVIRSMDEMIEMKTPERQIGLSFKQKIDSEIQEAMDRIVHFLLPSSHLSIA